ncbi:amphi-Trp domain-containing protein [Thermodesulfobacteriota bacterium]
MKEKMKTKMTVDLEKAIAYIECILDGLKRGEVVFEHSGGKVTLQPGKVVKLEIETEDHGDKQELELELKWRKEKSASPQLSEILKREYEPFTDWKPC